MSEIKFSRVQLPLKDLPAFLKLLGVKDPDDPLVRKIQGAMTRLQATEDIEALRNRRSPTKLTFKAEVVRFQNPDFGNGDLLLIGRCDKNDEIDPLNTNRWIHLPKRRV